MGHGATFPLFPLKNLDEYRGATDPLAAAYADLGKIYPEVAGILPTLAKDLGVTDVRYLTSPVVRLAYLVNSLPASMASHNSGPGGLFSHSVKVAVKAAHLAGEQWGKYRHIPEATDRNRFVLMTFWAGLLHDVGKIRDHLVSVPKGPRPKDQWDRYRPLTDWVRSQLPAGVSEFNLDWRHGRETTGPRSHEPYAALILDKVVIPKVTHDYLSVGQCNALILAFCGSCKAESSLPLYELVKSCDAHEASSEVSKSKATAAASATPAKGVGEGDRFADFRLGLHAVKDSTRIRWNHLQAHLLISPSHTAIVLDNDQGVVRLIYDYLAEATAKARVGGLVEAFFRSNKPFSLIEEIRNLVIDNGRDVALAHRVEGMEPHIIHYAAVADGKRLVKFQVVLFANRTLWGDVDISAFGLFTKPIQFYALDQETPTIDAEDVGFRGPARVKAAPATAPPTVVGGVKGAVPLDGIFSTESAEVAVGKLWTQIHRMVPLPADGPLASRYQAIEAAVGRGVSPEQVAGVVEACLFRLRAGMHSVGAEPLPAHEPLIAVKPATPIHVPAAAPVAVSRVDLVKTSLGILRGLLKAQTKPSLVMEGRFLLHDAAGVLYVPWPAVCEGVIDRPTIIKIQGATGALRDAVGIPYRRILVKFPGMKDGPSTMRVLVLDAAAIKRIGSGPLEAVGELGLVKIGDGWSLEIQSD